MPDHVDTIDVDADDLVGVVGAGVMGTGVAVALSAAGLSVALIDRSPDILERAEDEMRRQVRVKQLLAASGRTIDADVVLGRIRRTTEYDVLHTAAFVVENATESWAIKEPIYRRLDAVCRPRCVLAANTSAIPITRLASVTSRPQSVCGMHFMNPVVSSSAVEVVRGHHTSDETIDRARALAARLGLEAIVVNDMPGFVSNRVLMLAINEAIFLVQDGVAPAADIDRLFKRCFGHKMGPLETADLIGLDTILLTIEVLEDSYRDAKYRPCPLLRKMVAAGLLGRKASRGFYDYAGASREVPAATVGVPR